MENKNLNDYRSRLILEAAIKAVLFGVLVGGGVAFLVAFATWFVPRFNGVWVAVGTGVASAVGAGLISFYKVFRPSAKAIARRIDRIGLEERLITMQELEGDDSVIARLQREDAKAKLNEFDEKMIKVKVPTRLIASACACFVVGTVMVVFNGLGSLGVIETPGNVIFPEKEDVYVTVEYDCGVGGVVEGDVEQQFLQGGATTEVIAIADEGYVFDKWSDGYTDPVRSDVDVKESVRYVAKFVVVEESMDGDGEGDGNGDKPGQGKGDGNGQNGNQPGQGQQGGGKYEEINQIIDGETYYRDNFQDSYDTAMEQISANEEMSGDMREIIEMYYDSIK